MSLPRPPSLQWIRARSLARVIVPLQQLERKVTLRSRLRKAATLTAVAKVVTAAVISPPSLRALVMASPCALPRDLAKVVTVVESAEQLSRIPYWQQGDAELQTEAMLEKRATLRSHPQVRRPPRQRRVRARGSTRDNHPPRDDRLHAVSCCPVPSDLVRGGWWLVAGGSASTCRPCRLLMLYIVS